MFIEKENGELIPIKHNTNHVAGNYHIHPNEQDKSKSYFVAPQNWYGKDGILGQIIDKGSKKKDRYFNLGNTGMTHTNFGAVYNDYGRNALPVLGKYTPAGDEAVFDSQHRRIIQDGLFVPPSGSNLMKRIYSEPDGTLLFSAESTPSFPAFIFMEDFLVTNILTFSEDAPLWPELNAEDACRFTPNWLGNTELGRTLEYCHSLASTLVFQPEFFDFVNAEDFYLQDLREECLQFIEKLVRLSKASSLNAHDHSLNLRCLSFDCAPAVYMHNEAPSQKLYELQINHVKFCIEVFHKESQRLAQPITTFLFEYREAITILLPVFERLRQLYSLLYGVTEMHKMGYRMGRETREMHEKYLALFKGN